MDVVLDLRSCVTAAALEQVGDLVDVVSCSDDVAGMQSTLVSPAMYREFIKPRHQQYFDLIRSHTPAKLLYHSCGAVTRIIPDFIELGIDFINPVQVSAVGMDTARLKEEFGAEIGFWGSVDTMRVLPFGTEDEVRTEVKERVRDLAPGGGFVVAAVHNIQPNVPPQNIVAMFDTAREHGTYPITA
jgi:uroporphyrinogen decarboxylase